MNSILNSFGNIDDVVSNIDEQMIMIPEITDKYLMPKWF